MVTSILRELRSEGAEKVQSEKRLAALSSNDRTYVRYDLHELRAIIVASVTSKVVEIALAKTSGRRT
jgi:hypothetical protein